MKSTFLKVILVLTVVFGTIHIYAQEQQKAVKVEWDQKPIEEPGIDPVDVLMRPMYVIPNLELRRGGDLIHVGVANTSFEPVVVRLIFYDYAGNVQKVEESTLKGKQGFMAGFSNSSFPEKSFEGHMEMEATSPAAFVSVCFWDDVDNTLVRTPIQVFPIEH